MKKFLAMSLLVACAAAAQAKEVVPVSRSTMDCFFSPTCTNEAVETAAPVTLPGTTSNGLLRARVVIGQTNSPAQGLYGYEYQLDLSGIVWDPNHPPCLTNWITCKTNHGSSYSNVVTCRTSIVGVVKSVTCVTTIIPATNFMTCITNSIPGTNIVACFTNRAGLITCVTNVFPPTNYVVCVTTRVSRRKFVQCRTNVLDPGHLVIDCRTNRVRVPSDIVTCRTNLVPCPGAPPCVTSISLKAAHLLARADFNGDSNLERIYIVTNDVAGTVAPAAIERDGAKLVLHFDPPLCAGQTALSIGFVSAAPPAPRKARVRLTDHSRQRLDSVGPKFPALAECDFSELAEAIAEARRSQFLGATDAVRESRRAALLASVQAAAQAAQANHLDAVLQALASVKVYVDGRGDDWLKGDAAEEVRDALEDLLDCLDDATEGEGDDDDDD